MLVDLAADAAQKGYRDEGGGQDTGDGDHGGGHFLHGPYGRVARPQSLVDMALRGLYDHDGIIHHDADGQHEAEHAGHVDGKPQQREQSERAHDGHRNGEQRDKRGAPVLQEKEDHDDDQPGGFKQSHHDFLNGGAHEDAGIVGDDVIHAGGEAAFRLRHELAHAVGGGHGVGAGRQIDDEIAGRNAADAAEAAVAERPELHMADIADAEQAGIRAGAQDDIFKLGWIDEASRRGNRVLKVGAGGRGRLAQRTGGVLAVLRLNGSGDIAGGDAQLGHAVGIHPDPHGVHRVGSQAAFAHPLQAGHLVQQVDLRVVGEE